MGQHPTLSLVALENACRPALLLAGVGFDPDSYVTWSISVYQYWSWRGYLEEGGLTLEIWQHQLAWTGPTQCNFPSPIVFRVCRTIREFDPHNVYIQKDRDPSRNGNNYNKYIPVVGEYNQMRVTLPTSIYLPFLQAFCQLYCWLSTSQPSIARWLWSPRLHDHHGCDQQE